MSLPFAAAVAAGACAIVSTAPACDIRGTPEDQPRHGAALHVVKSTVDGPNDAKVEADGYVQIAFDRYLLPSTTTRQSFSLRNVDGTPIEVLPITAVYDPVDRTLTISGSNPNEPVWLTPGLFYRLTFPVAGDDDSNSTGFRALDRAPLDREMSWTFLATAAKGSAGSGAGLRTIDNEPKLDFCADIFPVLSWKCTNGCHDRSEKAYASLILATEEGIRTTAIGRVAQGANTAAGAREPSTAPKRFATNMPIITRGNPGESWLMYKLELAPPPDKPEPMPPYPCTRPSDPVPPPITTPVPFFNGPANDVRGAELRAELADYILGPAMPYPVPEHQNQCLPEIDSAKRYAESALTFDEKERIRLWIAKGAVTPDCGFCKDQLRDCP